MHFKFSSSSRFILLCFLGGWSLLLIFPPDALAFTQADSNPITVTSQAHILNFPYNIDFQIQATDSVSPITTATVYVGYDDYSYKSYTVPVNVPATTVLLSYREDLNSKGYIVPGSLVSYQWVLKDKAGNQVTSKSQEFSVIDTRFPWQKRYQGLIEVNWYSRPEYFGETLLKEANQDLERITVDLNVKALITRPIKVWIYLDDADFQSSLRAFAPDWSEGLAFPSIGQTFMIIDDFNDPSIDLTLPHELSHMILGQIATDTDVPSWFDEGMAVYQEKAPEPNLKYALKKALAKNALLRLYQIDGGFSELAGEDVDLAYAQSWDLVEYMYKTFGKEKMQLLIQHIADQNTTFDQDMLAALGLDSLHLENQWHLSLNQPPTLEPEVTPTPQPTQQSAPVAPIADDSNSPILITLGSLLMLIAVAGMGAVLIYQRQTQQKARANTEAQLPFASVSSHTPSAVLPAPNYPEQPDPPVTPITSEIQSASASVTFLEFQSPITPVELDKYTHSAITLIEPREYINFTPQNQAPQE